MSKIDDPVVLEAIDSAFAGVWSVLYSHLPPDGERHKEVGVALSRTLVALAAEGITDSEDLRRKALVMMALDQTGRHG
jgi:hypothetical protein